MARHPSPDFTRADESADHLAGRTFQMDFDFVDHMVSILVSDGLKEQLDLRPRSVAEFYHELMAKLKRVGVAVEIHGVPNSGRLLATCTPGRGVIR